MTEKFKINALMTKNIITKKWYYLLGMLLGITLMVTGFKIHTVNNYQIIKTQTLPDGKLYVEYKNGGIESDVVDKSDIINNKTYAKTDMESKVFIIIFGLVIFIAISTFFRLACKDWSYVEMKWEHYNLRNVRIHSKVDSNGCELFYVYDGHVLYKTHYFIYHISTVIDQLNEYRVNNGDGFIKFNQ